MSGNKARRTKRTPRRALLVVDMLNGFLDPAGGLYCGDHARKIIPFVRRRIQAYHRAGWPVIFICDAHDPDDPEFKIWPAHCVRGSRQARIIPELPTEGAHIVHKRTINNFHGTRLAGMLRRIAPELVEVVGVCTNICIWYAVAELRIRGYRVRVPKKGVATFDRKAHELFLQQMRSVLKAEVS
jgi:nicotinamidase/pyrazinamidase